MSESDKLFGTHIPEAADALSAPDAPEPRAAQVHDLKTWPLYFDAIRSGEKTFEFRRYDRDFRVGDVLKLREWDRDREQYTGRSASRRVTYLASGGLIPEGFCIMSIVPESAAAPRPAGPTPEGTREALSEKREADALKLCRERHNPLIEAACDRCIAEVIERNPSPEPVDRVRLIESRLRAYKNYAGYGGGFDRDIEYLRAALASARAALDEKDEKYITDTTALRAIIDEQQAALSEATRREQAILDEMNEMTNWAQTSSVIGGIRRVRGILNAATPDDDAKCARCGKSWADHYDGPFCLRDHGTEGNDACQFLAARSSRAALPEETR